MVVSGLLAVSKLVVGTMAGSTAVVADGVESAADVAASGLLLFALWVAARPADENHPYGHGRFETLAGLGLGVGLFLTGLVISYRSLLGAGEAHRPPEGYAVWPLVASVILKSGLSGYKFYHGRKLRSSALVADAWNDAVDILSGTTALAALGLTLYDPARFLAADHFGGAAVGVIVAILGIQVIRDASMQLVDTMPDTGMMEAIRAVATTVPGALGVEKCYARKTGLQYHVDLHLEVDPGLSVLEGHEIATQVRIRLKEDVDWVADVLVHVEPKLDDWKAEGGVRDGAGQELGG
jgi:cation diffusion facilitator family transporter